MTGNQGNVLGDVFYVDFMLKLYSVQTELAYKLRHEDTGMFHVRWDGFPSVSSVSVPGLHVAEVLAAK